MANTFTGLIKCKCGYNYRYISDRKISKYICSGYSRQLPNGCKARNSIEESILIDMVQIFCNRNDIQLIRSNEFMKSIIESIDINREENYISIKYKNGEVAGIKNNQGTI